MPCLPWAPRRCTVLNMATRCAYAGRVVIQWKKACAVVRQRTRVRPMTRKQWFKLAELCRLSCRCKRERQGTRKSAGLQSGLKERGLYCKRSGRKVRCPSTLRMGPAACMAAHQCLTSALAASCSRFAGRYRWEASRRLEFTVRARVGLHKWLRPPTRAGERGACASRCNIHDARQSACCGHQSVDRAAVVRPAGFGLRGRCVAAA